MPRKLAFLYFKIDAYNLFNSLIIINKPSQCIFLSTRCSKLLWVSLAHRWPVCWRQMYTQW